MNAKQNSRGFTLMELMIVLAIILIIMTIAIPKFMKAKSLANETAAIGTLKTLNADATMYSASYSNGYPPSLAALGPPAGGGNNSTCDHADLIDSVLATGRDTGYIFTYRGKDPIPNAGQGCANPGFNSYTINADPITRGETGQRSFFVDASGTVHYNLSQPATGSDPTFSGGS